MADAGDAAAAAEDSSRFQFVALAEWTTHDVGAWLRAGVEKRCGWEKKLSMDYTQLFEICGVTGDTLLEMKDYGREEWKEMKDELEEEHLEQGVVPVKLADRAKIKRVRTTTDICLARTYAWTCSLDMVGHCSLGNTSKHTAHC